MNDDDLERQDELAIEKGPEPMRPGRAELLAEIRRWEPVTRILAADALLQISERECIADARYTLARIGRVPVWSFSSARPARPLARPYRLTAPQYWAEAIGWLHIDADYGNRLDAARAALTLCQIVFLCDLIPGVAVPSVTEAVSDEADDAAAKENAQEARERQSLTEDWASR